MKKLYDFSDEQLIYMYRGGDETAIDEIFSRYKNIVKKKAKAMYIAGGENDDLIQEGMIGLYKAVRDFNPAKDASFSTFASLCINRQMINAVTASNRKKNAPLNTYVSFDEPASTGDGEVKLVDVLESGHEQNPEKLYIDREIEEDLRNKVWKALSPFEKKVLELYVSGNDYIEISRKLEKPAKSIDNALQRVRNKVDKITNV